MALEGEALLGLAVCLGLVPGCARLLLSSLLAEVLDANTAFNRADGKALLVWENGHAPDEVCVSNKRMRNDLAV